MRKCVEQKTGQTVKHIYPESEATSVEEDDWSSNKIQVIYKNGHSTEQISKDEQLFLTTTALVNKRPNKFIIEIGSAVTLIHEQMFKRITPIRPLQTEYRDINNNKITFEGKRTANVKTNGETKKSGTINNNNKIKPPA